MQQAIYVLAFGVVVSRPSVREEFESELPLAYGCCATCAWDVGGFFHHVAYGFSGRKGDQ
uniref:Uncharacterized protein n=1 Tax=Nelumbo nucifera TaxID=4432 RepID=A0A822XRL3_NELNU|nr:TPA_asm: hypothetical protein HUJ06_022878 [Nelumbo nucifera]